MIDVQRQIADGSYQKLKVEALELLADIHQDKGCKDLQLSVKYGK